MKIFGLAAFNFIVVSIAAGAALRPCGSVNRDTTLRSDCAGPLVVSANNIEINLGGRAVKCLLAPDGTRQGPGVALVNRTNVTLRNGTVGDLCEVAIQVDGGGGHRFSQLEVADNHESLLVNNSAENRIAHSVITGNYRGPQFTGSPGNTLFSLVIRDNQKTGLAFSGGSDDNVVDTVTITRNGSKLRGLHGLDFSGDAARNILMRSTLKGNYFGVSLGTGNVVVDSAVNDSATGGVYLTGRFNIVLDSEMRRNGFAQSGQSGGLALMPDDPTLPQTKFNVLRGNISAANSAFDFADHPAGSCTTNFWFRNVGGNLLDGCEAAQRPEALALAAGSGRLTAGSAFSYTAALDFAGRAVGAARFENLFDAAGARKTGVVEAALSCLTVDGPRAVAGFVVTGTAPVGLFPNQTSFHIHMLDIGKSSADFPDRAWISQANQLPPGTCHLPGSWDNVRRLDRGEIITYGRTH